jgi:hypothetical protein
VEEIAVLRDHQKDEAIDEAKEFVEPAGERNIAGLEALGEVGIGFEEAGTEELESELNLTGETVAGGFTFLGPSIAPAFEIAISGGSAFIAEAGAVEEEPEDGK